jgi:hypothetical protein
LPKEKRIRPFRVGIPLTATVEVPPKGGGGAWREVAAAPIPVLRPTNVTSERRQLKSYSYSYSYSYS